eukprot:96869-Chlamydomonas_euryale.AAC.2
MDPTAYKAFSSDHISSVEGVSTRKLLKLNANAQNVLLGLFSFVWTFLPHRGLHSAVFVPPEALLSSPRRPELAGCRAPGALLTTHARASVASRQPIDCERVLRRCGRSLRKRAWRCPAWTHGGCRRHWGRERAPRALA